MTQETKDPRAARATQRRRGGKGFRHASETARGSVDRVVGKKGFAESEVLLRWTEIVGDALATACRPVKVRYGSNRSLGATLIIQTDSGRAPEVSHQGPSILERVNQFYGYRAISRLKVTQSTGLAPGFAEQQERFVGPEHSVPARAQSQAASMAHEIENPELRAALTRMGSHILSRRKT